MTNEERRRAIAAGMASRRAATGQAERKATGQSMVERRTGKAVVEDINRLTDPRPPRKSLRTIEPIGALPASRGRGVYKAPVSGNGGGIASPLVEDSSKLRTFYDSQFIPSTDGLCYFELRPTKTLNMLDANGAEVAFQFAELGS